MSRESTSLQQSQYQHQNQNQDGPNLTTSQHVLLQKQQEYAGLQALRESSADMVARVEKLGEMSSIMADGGEALGQVLRNWPHIFSVLSLFEKPGERPVSPGGTVYEEQPQALPPLVRLGYEGESTSR